MKPAPTTVLQRPSWARAQYLADVLRTETAGGITLLVAAAVAMVWANSPWRESYAALRDTRVGYAPWHLDLSIGAWASDGLLALFFFVVGLELKREFLIGDLRSPRQAALPVIAACAGVAMPAIIFTAVVTVSNADAGALRGWAVPTATDIAFAVAVLAVIGSHLPSGLRTFLLTLAVVDDLIAITIIAIFYAANLHLVWLGLALLPLGAFALLVQRRVTSPWVLVPLAVLTWLCVHASGVHATVAGVLLGFTVPVLARRSEPDDTNADLAGRFEHRLRPLSSGFAVPVFAFFAAGVTVIGGGFADALRDPVAIAIVLALVLGKLIGVLGAVWAFATATRSRFDPGYGWPDIIGVAFLTGIGFTVALLVGDLAFEPGSARAEHTKLAIITASLIAATLGTIVLRWRNAAYRALNEEEARDDNADGIPDVYQRGE